MFLTHAMGCRIGKTGHKAGPGGDGGLDRLRLFFCHWRGWIRGIEGRTWMAAGGTAEFPEPTREASAERRPGKKPGLVEMDCCLPATAGAGAPGVPLIVLAGIAGDEHLSVLLNVLLFNCLRQVAEGGVFFCRHGIPHRRIIFFTQLRRLIFYCGHSVSNLCRASC